jgi:hypothetical protein
MTTDISFLKYWPSDRKVCVTVGAATPEELARDPRAVRVKVRLAETKTEAVAPGEATRGEALAEATAEGLSGKGI